MANLVTLSRLVLPLSSELSAVWETMRSSWTRLTCSCVYLSVVLCIVRGAPVIAEFVLRPRVRT